MSSLISENEKNFFSKVYTIFIVVYPLLETYASPLKSVGLGMFTFILFLPYILIDLYKKKIKVYVYYWFYIYSLIITLIMIIFLGNSSFSYRILFYTVGLIMTVTCARQYFNLQLGIKMYRSVAWLAVFFIIIQYIAYVFLGKIVPWVIDFLPLQYGISNANEYLSLFSSRYNTGGFRPTSFFLEPAYFAEYILPLYTILLFDIEKKEKKSIFLLFTIFFSVLISGSAGGFIYIAVLSIIWISYKAIKLIKRIDIFRLMILIIVLIFLVIMLIWVFDFFTTTDVIIRKITELFSAEIGTSGTVRVLRGFLIFDQLDIIHKFFGLGFSNYPYVFKVLDIATYFDVGVGDNVSYMCTIAHILVSTGIVGFILFIFALFEFFKNGDCRCKALIILFLMICMSSNILYKQTYILCLVFIVALRKREKNEFS